LLWQLDADEELLEQRLDLAIVRVVDQQRALAVGDLAVAERIGDTLLPLFAGPLMIVIGMSVAS
jgi:hypothetical protein